jgi:hypothetical protein
MYRKMPGLRDFCPRWRTGCRYSAEAAEFIGNSGNSSTKVVPW